MNEQPPFEQPPEQRQFQLPIPRPAQPSAPDNLQSPGNPKENRRRARQWYRPRTRKARLGVVCGAIIVALLLSLGVTETLKSGNNWFFRSSSTPSGPISIAPQPSSGSNRTHGPSGTTFTPSATGFPYVRGNQIIDGSGHPLILHGAMIQTAFAYIAPWQQGQNPLKILNSTTFNAMRSWNMNAIRINISYWIYRLDPALYMSRLDTAVSQANQAGLYVVLDFHDDLQSGSPYGDAVMHPESITFWSIIAKEYLTNSMVMFDLVNEPHYADWQTWLNGNGGNIVGHQAVVRAIRSLGARQIIIAESLEDGASGFSTIGSNLISDPNIVYSIHIYLSDLFNGSERTPTGWSAKFGNLSATHPVYIGEWAFLPNANYPTFCANITPAQATQVVQNFLAYMQQHSISWTAWSFTASHLIQNYATYAPTTLNAPWCCGQGPVCSAGMGEILKTYLVTHSF